MSQPGAVIHDADAAAERILRALQDNAMISVTGNKVPVKIDSICVHGDTRGAAMLASRIRQALIEAGVSVLPVGEPTSVS